MDCPPNKKAVAERWLLWRGIAVSGGWTVVVFSLSKLSPWSNKNLLQFNGLLNTFVVEYDFPMHHTQLHSEQPVTFIVVTSDPVRTDS